MPPRKVIETRLYNEIISDPQARQPLDKAEQTQAALEKTRGEIDHLQGVLDMLRPWATFETPVEDLGRLRTGVSWAGLVPSQHFDAFEQQLADVGAALQKVNTAGKREAVVVVALRENIEQIQKLLRSYEFEIVTFEPMTGTAASLIREHEQKLAAARGRLEEHRKVAGKLSANLLKLQVLYDHYRNMLEREHTRNHVPATEQAMILEGWCKKQDYPRLEKLVARFDAASLSQIQPAEGEDVPVEIHNSAMISPFETVTRLYGMPVPSSVDPTMFLAPFFAIFFGLCLADAGYGLIMTAVLVWVVRKMQGNKGAMVMLLMCGVTTHHRRGR